MEVSTPGMIVKIHIMVVNDRRIKVREIVKATDLTQGTMFLALHEILAAKEILARWVTRLLPGKDKRNSITYFEALFHRNPEQCL